MHDPTGPVTRQPSDPLPDGILALESSFTGTGLSDGPSFEAQFDRAMAFQRERLPTYTRYLNLIGDAAAESPHLPIESFKRSTLCTVAPANVDAVFLSSGTASIDRSRHHVFRLGVYERSIRVNFERNFGSGPFTIAAHLPGYDKSSSLLYMVRCLVRNYGDEASGFFHSNIDGLRRAVEWSDRYGTQLILFGVAFGLLDLLDLAPFRIGPRALVIETGGMKTHRREIRRSELHERLSHGFGTPRSRIVSEYGMTEMLSQCYTRGGEIFYPPSWMRFEVRSLENPLEHASNGEPGVLAVIDLANMYSVSAILTEDLAVRDGEGFRVLGRLQGAQLRGCNLLLEDLDQNTRRTDPSP
jgi:hypothetical protein